MIDLTIFIPNSTSKGIYELLTVSKMHSKLTGDIAEIDTKVGGKFSTFGGYATGEILKLEPNKLVKQTWQASDWPKGHFSIISFELSDKKGGTSIHFTQDKLPAGTVEEFESGWEDFYWTPLKEYFTKN